MMQKLQKLKKWDKCVQMNDERKWSVNDGKQHHMATINTAMYRVSLKVNLIYFSLTMLTAITLLPKK